MNTLTVVVTEVSSPYPPVYPRPLIYAVELPDLATDDDVLDAVSKQRALDLGLAEDDEGYEADLVAIRAGIRLEFAFDDDVTPEADWRD